MLYAQLNPARIPDSGLAAEPDKDGACCMNTARVREGIPNEGWKHVLRQRCGTAAEYEAYKQAGGRKQFE